ncbi:unnamed protein product [Lota lota]
MLPLCDSCGDHVDKLNQQVSIMRKEIKNLRQMLENAVRSHRKHMTSLLSAVTNVAQGSLVDNQQQSLSAKTDMSPHVSLEQGTIQTVPIGYIRSCFSAKNGTPRQPTVCGHSRATLCIQPSVFNNPDHALMGLQHFSHVWVIFLFHKNGHLSYKAKVKPPRLNGQRVGLYSTRTPHRPNALGLTLARVDRIIGDTIHLSGIDMIDGTPVLDIKPYISDYDSPLSRPGGDVEPYEMDVGQSEMAAFPPDEIMGDTLSFRMNSGTPSSGRDTSLAKAEFTKVTSANSSPRTTFKDEAITADVENRSEASSLPVADANAYSAAPLSKELSNVLVEVKAYVNETDLNSDKEVSKSKRPETTPCSPELCYGEEAYSTIAAWIRAPPVGNLEVRFTPHAQRELAKFLPPQHSDHPGNIRPHFKFLRSQEEAVAAIRGVLSADPRSIYRRTRCGDRLFFFTLDTADITCWFGPDFAEVLRVQPVGS